MKRENMAAIGSKTRLGITGLVMAALVLTGLCIRPAIAEKADSEPKATTAFGKKNRRINTRNPVYGAVNAALTNDFGKAFSLADKSGSRTAGKLVEWIYLRKKPKQAGYRRLMAFVHENPNWPYVKTLTRYAEYRLMAENASPATLAAHFNRTKPRSAAGHAIYARLKASTGNMKAARAHLLKAWYNPQLQSRTRQYILTHMRKLLPAGAYEKRLWKLVHAQKTKAAIDAARLVSRTHVRAAKVARMLIRRRKGAFTAYRKLPASMRNKLAMRYALARYHRRKNNYISALNILRQVSAKKSAIYDQKAWWTERRLIIRYLLGPANARLWPALYQQATAHGFTRGSDFEEGEFLAGWIALRKLGKPNRALVHLKRLATRGQSRTQRARGAYWTARAYLELGNRKNADYWFRTAARTPTLYYAQLAREAIGLGRKPILIRPVGYDRKTKRMIASSELMQAVKILAKSGGQREIGAFIWPVARQLKSRIEASAAADLFTSAGGPHLGVRLAKAAGRYGHDIDNWGYPVRAMPRIKRIGKPVETAVIFAISRQESEFNTTARSYVGARGLMQIMPTTAKRVAKRYRLRHSTAKLTTHPAYNAMLGAALLGDLIDQFNGSYVLTFVGYNAGPGRARQWLKIYGDPRNGQVDPVDWVESVPFTETRKYIQKVLQNVQVYRSRINPRAVVPLSADLARGHPPQVTSTGKKLTVKCGKARSITALIQGC